MMDSAAANGVHVQMEELDQQQQQAGDNRPQNPAGGGGGGPHAPNFDANDAGTLLVVATLITALSYQLGTNIPGGWAGFGASMLLTVGLLTGVPAKSRFVRCAFLVAYSSLVLTFVTSQPRTSLAMDIAIWVGVMAALAVVTTYLRVDKLPSSSVQFRVWSVRKHPGDPATGRGVPLAAMTATTQAAKRRNPAARRQRVVPAEEFAWTARRAGRRDRRRWGRARASSTAVRQRRRTERSRETGSLPASFVLAVFVCSDGVS
ncbi:hypothetical protein BAE44_0010895 [Dichanthelium oligosanthes]|uniref:Uncharacterized protein n=1 Tax=Dichanthelium oligosanthes TaxID=888268 RepID=A0A1E5VSI4_9POAL|nr:hypothetical protein BAE44_0010895 [Dichanthelium oligosanthes]